MLPLTQLAHGCTGAQAVFNLVTDCKSRLRIAVLEDCTNGARRRLSAAQGASMELDSSRHGAAGTRVLLGQPAEGWPGQEARQEAALREGLWGMGSDALQQLWRGEQLSGLNGSSAWQFWQ